MKFDVNDPLVVPSQNIVFFMAPGQLGARLGASTFYIESLWENENWFFISILMNIWNLNHIFDIVSLQQNRCVCVWNILDNSSLLNMCDLQMVPFQGYVFLWN